MLVNYLKKIIFTLFYILFSLIIHNDFQLITTLINFVPCSEFFIFFLFFNLISPQKNNINVVICRQLNIKI